MLEILKTINSKIVTIDTFEDGSWINLINPTESELSRLSTTLGVDIDMLKAPLDEEESARIENEEGQLLIVVDIPIIEKEGRMNVYTTIPLGIILFKQYIITVCLRNDTLLSDFVNNRVKTFFTQYKTRFILQVLYKNATRYLQYLRHIDKISSRIEQDLHKSTKNKELIQMLKLQKSLVYFSTSLKSNELVLEKLLKHEYLRKYPSDADLLEDVIIENKQAIEMATIYSGILSGMMDAFASVISNNLNIVMKVLTTITILMAIPTMFASFYGMNVINIPFAQSPYGFWIVLGTSVVTAGIVGFILAKKNLF